MKIAYLSGYSVIHTVRWANEMSARGHEVHLLSLHEGEEALHHNVQLHILPYKTKLGYYLNKSYLRRKLNELKPDLLNTHFASGYGTLARLTGYRPNLLSVWGNDVYEFPYQSFLLID